MFLGSLWGTSITICSIEHKTSTPRPARKNLRTQCQQLRLFHFACISGTLRGPKRLRNHLQRACYLFQRGREQLGGQTSAIPSSRQRVTRICKPKLCKHLIQKKAVEQSPIPPTFCSRPLLLTTRRVAAEGNDVADTVLLALQKCLRACGSRASLCKRVSVSLSV